MLIGLDILMQQQVISANPALLRWARRTAGLSVQDAVLRAKIGKQRQRKNEESTTAEEQLISWEEGRAAPSLTQLKALANVYRRPLVTFFLPKPPTEVAQLMDYRTVPNTPQESTEFAALKRRIYQLHRELNAIAKEEEREPLSFVGSCTMRDGVFSTVDTIRSVLTFCADEIHNSSCDTFCILRDKIQRAGVYIILMGDLGNYKSKVTPDEFRGIAIADTFAPLIVINRYDTPASMLFTLVHELAHIFLGSSGVSNQNVFESKTLHKSLEQFCNAVAAEFLVPEVQLRSSWNEPCVDLEKAVEQLVRFFHVSSEVILRRLSDLGYINEEEYSRLISLYRARWKRIKEKNRTSAGGQSANILARYNIGTKILSTLLRAVDGGLITLLDAARVLNMSVSRFEKVAK